MFPRNIFFPTVHRERWRYKFDSDYREMSFWYVFQGLAWRRRYIAKNKTRTHTLPTLRKSCSFRINGMINDMSVSVFKMKFIHPCCKLSPRNNIFMNLKTNIKLILNYDAEHELYFFVQIELNGFGSNRLGIIILRRFFVSNYHVLDLENCTFFVQE